MENAPSNLVQMQHIPAEGALKVRPGHKLGLRKQWTAHVREEEFLQQFYLEIELS